MFFFNTFNHIKLLYNKLDDYIIVFKNKKILFINEKMKYDFDNEFNEDNEEILKNFYILSNLNKFNNNYENFKINLLNNKIDFITLIGQLNDIQFKIKIEKIKKFDILIIKKLNNEDFIFNKKEINSNKTISNLLEKFPLPIFYKNKFGFYVACNELFLKFMGFNNKEQVIGKKLYTFEDNPELAEIYESRDYDFIKKCESDILNKKRKKENYNVHDYIEILEFIFKNKNKNGTAILYKNIYIENDNVNGIVGVIIDKSKEKNELDKLKSSNYELSIALQTDFLTKLKNKLAFNDMFIDKIRHYTRYKNKGSFILLIFDIDNFKKINDNYGHSIGDIVLKEITQKIKNDLRLTDKMYRIGGEEFAIIIDGIDFNDTDKFANKILNIVRNIKFLELNNNNITISIGIGEYNSELDFEEDIQKTSLNFFNRVDKKLYEAKNKGKNRYEK